VGRPAQRTQGSVPENQFRRPRPDLHGGRLTQILEPLSEPRETSTAPAREEEHHAAGSPSNRPRWTETRESTSSTKARRQQHHTTTTENNRQPMIRTRPGHPESSRSKDFLPEQWIGWNRRALSLCVSLRERVQGKGIHLRSRARECYREEGSDLRSWNEEARENGAAVTAAAQPFTHPPARCLSAVSGRGTEVPRPPLSRLGRSASEPCSGPVG
jgi:hypothetical protein